MVKRMNNQTMSHNKPGIVLENFQIGERTNTPELVEHIKKALACTCMSDTRAEPYCRKLAEELKRK